MKFNEIDFNLRNIVIFASTIAILLLLYATRDILILFIVSVLIAYLLNPIVEIFVRLHIPRFLSVLLLVIILLLIIIVLVAVMVPAMIKDITYIITHTPQYINNIFTWLEDTLAKFNIQSSFDLETSKNYVTERLGVISKYILNTLSSAAVSVKNIAGVLVNIFIVPVLVFFLLTDFPDFHDNISLYIHKPSCFFTHLCITYTSSNHLV